MRIFHLFSIFLSFENQLIALLTLLIAESVHEICGYFSQQFNLRLINRLIMDESNCSTSYVRLLVLTPMSLIIEPGVTARQGILERFGMHARARFEIRRFTTSGGSGGELCGNDADSGQRNWRLLYSVAGRIMIIPRVLGRDVIVEVGPNVASRFAS